MIYTENLEKFGNDLQLIISEQKVNRAYTNKFYFAVRLTTLGKMLKSLNLLSPQLCKYRLIAELKELHFDRRYEKGVTRGFDHAYRMGELNLS